MCPEGCNEDVDDHSDEDQGRGSVVELVQPPLLFHLVQVQPRWGEWRVRGESQGGATAWSSPYKPSRVQRKSGISEIQVADAKGGGVGASSLTDQCVGIHGVRHRIGVWELALSLLRVGMCSHGR